MLFAREWFSCLTLRVNRRYYLITLSFWLFLTVILTSIVILNKRPPQQSPSSLSLTPQNRIEDTCNESRPIDHGWREVISPYRSVVSSATIGFDKLEWGSYQNQLLGIGFDFPKNIFVLYKETIPLDWQIEPTGTESVELVLSNCLNDFLNIRFITGSEEITYKTLEFEEPEKFDRDSSLKEKIIETTLAGQKAKLRANNSPQQVPSGSYLVYFYRPDGALDYLVQVDFPKIDIDAYLEANQEKWPAEDLKRYKEFTIPLTGKILDSLRFSVS